MTDRTSAFTALAYASAAMLGDHHPADLLARLTIDCITPLAADSAALLVAEPGGGLNLLTASSHAAADIELLQTQRSHGPCVDAIRTGEHVYAVGEQALVDRWDEVGTAIVGAGFESVHAFPMRWQGGVIGGLNIFRSRDAGEDQEDTAVIGQAFADAATLILVHVSDVSAEQVAERVHEAVLARSAVEQAKGVLAYLNGTDPEAAYRELVRLAEADDGSLTEIARHVVRQQHG